MDELGIRIQDALQWFNEEANSPYTLVRVSEEDAENWVEILCDAFRRGYISDDFLANRANALEQQSGNSNEVCQSLLIGSKLPDRGSTMSGDFGEIVVYIYQAANAHPQNAFGPKKWRLKQDRTKPAPYSDVVHFVLPQWPNSSDDDQIICSEVKAKATGSNSLPIESAIKDCAKDRTSRLAKTLVWLKERSISEDLGAIGSEHLDRFIHADMHPEASKSFHAVVVISSELLTAELAHAPDESSDDYTLTIIAIPHQKSVYERLYEAVKNSTVPGTP